MEDMRKEIDEKKKELEELEKKSKQIDELAEIDIKIKLNKAKIRKEDFKELYKIKDSIITGLKGIGIGFGSLCNVVNKGIKKAEELNRKQLESQKKKGENNGKNNKRK